MSMDSGESALQALAGFDRALAFNPDWIDALKGKALALKALGRIDEAFQILAKAIAVDPQDGSAFNDIGLVLMDLGQFELAKRCLEASVELLPNSAACYNNLGTVLNVLKQYEPALACFDQAIGFDAQLAHAYSNRSSALEGLMRLSEAIQSCEMALQLDAKLVKTRNKLGVMLTEVGSFEKALGHFDHLIDEMPDYVPAHINKANALSATKRFDEAKQSLQTALLLDPENNLARWNLALLLLRMGDYANGWPLYELGWAIHMRGYRRDFSHPAWLGDVSIAGKTLLLWAEQGLGDSLQFCRYVSLVKSRGARVLLELPQPLTTLLSAMEGVDECIEAGKPLPPFDFHCPLMSLPFVFQTTLQTIPSPNAYLQADPQKVRHWSNKFRETGRSRPNRLKVGLVWNGGARPNQPNLWYLNQRRNIDIEIVSFHLKDIDADFWSLQKGEPAESALRGKELSYWPKGNLFNFVDDLLDFADTAALITNLDLVISVDTSTAHLAAALGKPTWILSRYDNCWRWLEERADSPWYASVKLYRQGDDRDWNPVVAQVARDLRHYLSQF